MGERFKDSREREEAFQKMQKTQYSGNTLKYIDTLQSLNQRVHLFGLMTIPQKPLEEKAEVGNRNEGMKEEKGGPGTGLQSYI